MPASNAVKHKETNKFRFKTFSQRLSEIKVSANLYQIYKNETTGEQESHVTEAMNKWLKLDLTQHHVDFRNEIAHKWRNYKLVVHNADHIINSLAKHLQVKDSLSLQSLLEILVAACRDLTDRDITKGFYPHFRKFFKILVGLLSHTQDPERIEWTFTCMARLFKHLQRSMIKDLDNVLELYTTLFVGQHPAHIATFASQSVSYLLRKTDNHKHVLVKLFEVFEQDATSSSDGLAKVVLEIVKLSQHQFHSCIANFLPQLFTFLDEANTNHSSVDCVIASVRLMTNFTRRQHASPLLAAILDKIDASYDDVTALTRGFRALREFCSVGSGSRLCDVDRFKSTYRRVLEFSSNETDDPALRSEVCRLTACVLACEKSPLEIGARRNLLETFTTTTAAPYSFAESANLWRRVFRLSDFAFLAQKSFVEFCQRVLSNGDEQDQENLIGLMLDRCLEEQSLPRNSQQLVDYKRACSHALLPVSGMCEVVSRLVADSQTPHRILFQALVLATRIRGSKVSGEALACAERVLQGEVVEDCELAVASVALQLVCCTTTEQQPDFTSLSNRLHEIATSHQLLNRHLLFCVEVLVKRCARTRAIFAGDDALKRSLVANLSSGDAVCMSLSLRILRTVDGAEDEVSNLAYTHLIEAVETANTLQGSRDRSIHLRKLDAKQGFYHKLDGLRKEAAVRTLLAQFYLNFSDVWQPARDIIVSLSCENKKDEFWTVLIETLTASFEKARASRWWFKSAASHRRKLLTVSENDKDDDEEEEEEDRITDHLLTYMSEACDKGVNSRVDHFNYRLQVLKTVSSLPHASTVEGFNRQLSGLLFDFLEHEYEHLDSYGSRWQRLSEERAMSADEDVVCRRKDGVRALVAIMSVFARFRNPRNAANEAKLHDLYETFLTHSDAQLQRVALDCVLTYRNPTLLLHKDRLLELFDEKKFRDALTTYDVTALSEESRDELVPTLMRLLYGRMRSNVGGTSKGKSHAPERRSLIIRFISGLDRRHVTTFFHLIAKPFDEYLRDDVTTEQAARDAAAKASDELVVVPVKKQLGFIGSITTLLNKLNKDMPVEVYDQLHRLLICTCAATSTLIAHPSLHQRHAASLRGLRKVVMECTIDLLASWPDSHVMSADQVRAMVQVLIAPDCDKLIDENVTSPTAHLKLLLTLTKRKLHIPFLNSKLLQTFETPLDALVSVLESEKSRQHVEAAIVDGLVGCLTCDDDDNDDDAPLTSEQCDAIARSVDGKVEMSGDDVMECSKFSLRIIKPHIPRIVEFFTRRLGSKPTGVSPNELKLIGVISEQAECEETLVKLSKILIQHALKSCKLQQRNNNPKSLKACLETLKHVMRSRELVIHAAPLFSKVWDRECRGLLCEVVVRACGEGDMKGYAETVVMLNSWDERRVDEIDFDKRLTAFRELIQTLKSDEKLLGKLPAYLPIFHTCLYTLLNHSDDISLRDNVARVFECTLEGVKKLADEGLYRTYVRELLLSTLQRGVNSPNLQVRRQSLRTLANAVRTFPDEPTLAGLSCMIHPTNPDDDSFENLIHIQMHRQARAIRKFAHHICPSRYADVETSSSSSGDEVIPRSSAIRYILPFVVQTVYTVEVRKDSGYYHDACYELVKSICAVMTWSQLKRFLIRMCKSIETKKFALEILKAALDAFPFDLSLADDESVGDEKKPQQVMDADDEKEKNDEEADDGDEDEEKEGEDDEADDDDEMETDESLKEQAQKIVDELVGQVLPLLRKVLARKTADDETHKKARHQQMKMSARDQCRHKLPLAVAIVAMLEKLPPNMLKTQLSSVVYKVVDYLRHKQFEIREWARDALCKCVGLLGPAHLLTIVQVLHTELSRGYHKHVMVRACCNMLSTLQPKLVAGSLDSALPLLLEVLLEDVFGRLGEDKRSQEVRAKIPEAKNSKVYGALNLIASSISKKCLLALIKPLEEQAVKTNEHKIKEVIHKCLGEISKGLMESCDLTPEDYLTLSYFLLDETALKSIAVKQEVKVVKEAPHPGLRPPSCYLLNTKIARMGAKPVSNNSKCNLHLMVEFALQIAHFAISKKMDLDDIESRQLLDPLVNKFTQCMHAKHRQTVINSMKCMERLFEADHLPTLEHNLPVISKQLFKIVKDHSQQGGTDQESATLSFKCLSSLCHSDHGVQLTDVQLKTLLAYAESALEADQRAHAFKLIRAVVKRDVKNDDVGRTMGRIRELAVISHGDEVRAQARKLYMFYVERCGFGEMKLVRQLEWWLAQLEYEYEAGRSSAIQIVTCLLQHLSPTSLHKKAMLLYVTVAKRLFNEDSSDCKKLLAVVMKRLITKLDRNQLDQMFSLLLKWYGSGDCSMETLASILVALFAEVEGEKMQSRLNKVFQHISTLLVVKDDEKELDDDDQRERDHALFCHLSAALSCMKHCKILGGSDWKSDIDVLVSRARSLLHYLHDWVALVSSQLISAYFDSVEPQDLKVNTEDEDGELAIEFTHQLQAAYTQPLTPQSQLIAGQALDNIVYMVRVHDAYRDDKSIKRLIVRMSEIAKMEQANTPKACQLRSIVIKFATAFCIKFTRPEGFLKHVLDPIVRATRASATHGNVEVETVEELHDLAVQAMEVIKKRVGADVFNDEHAAVVEKISTTRRERKMKKEQLLVADPERAANLKIRKQQRVKEQRKRKTQDMNRPQLVKKIKADIEE